MTALHKLNYLIGQKYGKLTILKVFERINNKPRKCEVVCECGNIKQISLDNLKSGATKSCGCLIGKSNIKHGDSHSRLYVIWRNINNRCYYKKDINYKNYGGRGIKVCKEWRDSYPLFKEWAIKSGYKETLTIDRIDNNGNYSPQNCKWSTRKEQNRNKSTTKLNSTKVKEIKILLKQNIAPKDIAKKFNVHKTTIYDIKRNRIWKDIK